MTEPNPSMARDIATTLQETLEKQLHQQNLCLVDIMPIPSHGDRMVRLRTLEEALEDFDNPEGGATIGYLVRVGPMRKETKQLESENPKNSLDGIYLPNGKLNVPYLATNAELLFETGEYALARNIYKTIVQSGERTSVGLYGLAKCFEAEGKIEDAKTHYEESIAYHPMFDAYQRLAAILIKQKKDQEAAEALARALHLKELSPAQRFELHQTCGNCWGRAKRPDKAETHYLKALELDPSSDEMRSNIGALCLQAGKLDEAKKNFQDALASNPQNAKALFGMGSCYLTGGDKRNAHDHFARSLDLDIQNPTAIFHLVKCAYEIKSYATAARILENYIDIAPVNTNLLYSLAGLQFHLERVDEARSTIEKILQMSPDHAGAKELQGIIDQR